MQKVEDYKKNTKVIGIVFSSMTLISYLYVIVKGSYNGDFLNLESTLSYQFLTLLLLLSLIPYVYLYKVYMMYKKKYVKRIYIVNKNLICLISLLILLTHILIASLDIGIMGDSNKSSLAYIYTLLNLLNPYLYSFVYIYYNRNNKVSIIINIILLIILMLLRQSLGGAIMISMFLFLFYGSRIMTIAKRHFLIVICLILLAPMIVSILYSTRNSMRKGEAIEFVQQSEENIMVDRLSGRLSSYSNLCSIFENAIYWGVYSTSISDYHYVYTILDRFGIHLNTSETPEQFMYYTRIGTDDSDSIVTFMLGTVGKLVVSLFKSFKSFTITLLLMLLLIDFSFKSVRQMHIDTKFELCFIMLIFPLLSGVSYELFFTFFQLYIFSIITKITQVRINRL